MIRIATTVDIQRNMGKAVIGFMLDIYRDVHIDRIVLRYRTIVKMLET